MNVAVYFDGSLRGPRSSHSWVVARGSEVLDAGVRSTDLWTGNDITALEWAGLIKGLSWLSGSLAGQVSQLVVYGDAANVIEALNAGTPARRYPHQWELARSLIARSLKPGCGWVAGKVSRRRNSIADLLCRGHSMTAIRDQWPHLFQPIGNDRLHRPRRPVSRPPAVK